MSEQARRIAEKLCQGGPYETAIRESREKIIDAEFADVLAENERLRREKPELEQQVELIHGKYPEAFALALFEIATKRCGYKGIEAAPPSSAVNARLDELEHQVAALRAAVNSVRPVTVRVVPSGWLDRTVTAPDGSQMPLSEIGGQAMFVCDQAAIDAARSSDAARE